MYILNLSNNPKLLSTFISYTGATTSKNNGGGLGLAVFLWPLYSLPVNWGNFNRCFGEFSVGAKHINYRLLELSHLIQ